MTPIDPERTQNLISSMREATDMLHDLSTMPEDEFRNDRHKQSSAKYNFITAIEAAIDLANHIISKKGLRSPEDYADTFQVLAEANILNKEFAEELGNMARFRNRLVHVYWKVGTKELWKILQSRLGDFDEYLHCLGKTLWYQ
jgi:uncharacterized protein YutE (UPF0331/DUF86 family)